MIESSITQYSITQRHAGGKFYLKTLNSTWLFVLVAPFQMKRKCRGTGFSLKEKKKGAGEVAPHIWKLFLSLFALP